MAILRSERSAVVAALAAAGTAAGTLVFSVPSHALQAQTPPLSPGSTQKPTPSTQERPQAPTPGQPAPTPASPQATTPALRSSAAPATPSVADSSLEYGVKAAYLLNFTRYVEWPGRLLAERAPIVLCVYGSDPFGNLLERTVRGRTSQGHHIEVRRTDLVSETRGCHAVFISEAEWRRGPDVLEALAQHGVLTVGEGTAFASAGGVISFVIEDHAVRFAVNLTASKRADLRLSSRLLTLATHVYGERKTEP